VRISFSAQVCTNCKDARASHKNELGETGANCVWPEGGCRQFTV